jgi:hypothetical protein
MDRDKLMQALHRARAKAQDELREAAGVAVEQVRKLSKIEGLAEANRAMSRPTTRIGAPTRGIDSIQAVGPFRLGASINEYRDLGLYGESKSEPTNFCPMFGSVCTKRVTVVSYAFDPSEPPISFGDVPVEQVILETIEDQLVGLRLRLSTKNQEALAVLSGALTHRYGEPEDTDGGPAGARTWHGQDIAITNVKGLNGMNEDTSGLGFERDISIVSKKALTEAFAKLSAKQSEKRDSREKKIKELEFSN